MTRLRIINNNIYISASYFWLIKKNIPNEITNVMTNVICPERRSNITD